MRIQSRSLRTLVAVSSAGVFALVGCTDPDDPALDDPAVEDPVLEDPVDEDAELGEDNDGS